MRNFRPAGRELRLTLFDDAMKKNLADSGDVLVSRKKTGVGRTVKEKHIDDIWCLVGANKRCEPVPRVLLRNGKRGKDELQKSQASSTRKREVDGASNDALVPVSAVHGQSNATSGLRCTSGWLQHCLNICKCWRWYRK